jgi:hypothetical protein
MAISIAPSDYWDCNDGSWSTFNLNVGTAAQQMRVLPATSLSYNLVVLAQGCPSSFPANCPSLRGNIFDPSPARDISWNLQQPPSGASYFYLPFSTENVLPNYTDDTIAGEVGFDVIILDWSGPRAPGSATTIKNQTIAGFADSVSWLGLLGISGCPSHVLDDSSAQLSPLQSLQQSQGIALSCGYTAGASWANNSSGSLTFGGYDSARADLSRSIAVEFKGDSNRDLEVLISYILVNGTSGSDVNVLGNSPPISAVADSTVTDIWLPLEACQQFESTLGIQWNDTIQMYLVNDTLHASLEASNPAVTF